jgi:hypothetical protein
VPWTVEDITLVAVIVWVEPNTGSRKIFLTKVRQGVDRRHHTVDRDGRSTRDLGWPRKAIPGGIDMALKLQLRSVRGRLPVRRQQPVGSAVILRWRKQPA